MNNMSLCNMCLCETGCKRCKPIVNSMHACPCHYYLCFEKEDGTWKHFTNIETGLCWCQNITNQARVNFVAASKTLKQYLSKEDYEKIWNWVR